MPPQEQRDDSADTASSRLMQQAQQFGIGSSVWVESSDNEEVWSLAGVRSQDKTVVTIVTISGGERLDVDLGFAELHPANPKVVADLTGLFHINEPGILHCLGERARAREPKPYTFMGTLLIAVNPLRRLPEPPESHFRDKALDPETPHPYAIAELAYHQLRLGGTGGSNANQSIIVSGESGAGKTETSKIILRYLARRGNSDSDGGDCGGVTGLDDRVVESSPILEAFGNAKTLRNNNSSRFGKFIKLLFGSDGAHLAGGQIETYLLEKSRVLTQSQGERNFHAFYQLLAGAPEELRAELSLGQPEDYATLDHSGCVAIEDVDDAEGFDEVDRAFGTSGLDAARRRDVWSVVAAVLHLASIDFMATDTEEGEVAEPASEEAFSTTARLIGVADDVLKRLLCEREVKARGETFTKRLDVTESNYARDATAKALYESLFLWLVRAINVALMPPPAAGADAKRGGKTSAAALPFIGVLDIFGFENFEENAFEQLLINFTNESLQDTFNKQVFRNELRLYEEEGIEVVVSSCPDNSECIDLLSAKVKGIIPALTAICQEPNSSDSRYLERLHKTYGSGSARHQHFPPVHPKDQQKCFMVKHFAGKVKYTVDGWVVRNMDRIPDTFADVCAASTMPICKEMGEAYAAAGTAAAAAAPSTGGDRRSSGSGSGSGRSGGGGGTTRSIARPSVGKSFLDSMTQLSAVLSGTASSFVRCIKPNAAMEAGVYSNRYVVDQLQCLGILQTCEVLKVGMPTRVTYAELKAVLGPQAGEAELIFRGEPETALISAILWAFEIPQEAYRLGRTRVFFKAGMISQLEAILRNTTAERAGDIVKRLRIALEDRRQAKAAADKARAAVDGAAAALAAARAEVSATLGPGGGNEGGGGVGEPFATEEEFEELANALRGAKKAALCRDQVAALLAATVQDDLGRRAPDARGRVDAEAAAASAAAEAAAAAATALESLLAAARGGDEEGRLQRLRKLLAGLEKDGIEAEKLATTAEEAAARCQRPRAEELQAAAEAMAVALSAGAGQAVRDASAAQQAAAERRAAFAAAKRAAEEAANADAGAHAAYAAFKAVVAAADKEEREARAKFEEEERRLAEEQRAAAAAAAAAAKAAAAAAAASAMAAAAEEAAAKKAAADEAEAAAKEKENDVVPGLMSPSKRGAARAALLSRTKQQQSCSVRDLLNSELTAGLAQHREPGKGKVDVASVPIWRSASTDTTAASLAPPPRKEGHLMKQHNREPYNWVPRYFVLEDGFLEYYDKKSMLGGDKKKKMALSGGGRDSGVGLSLVTYTTTKNCFCVQTGELAWSLLAKNEDMMEEWMAAINAQIRFLYRQAHPLPPDNYWGRGTPGRFLYEMVETAAPQWIRTDPEHNAPYTGEGIFPTDVIEVVQVLSRHGIEFLRLADDRGWTFTRHPEDNSLLFEETEYEPSAMPGR